MFITFAFLHCPADPKVVLVQPQHPDLAFTCRMSYNTFARHPDRRSIYLVSCAVKIPFFEIAANVKLP